MVRLNGVDDVLVFLILLSDLDTQLNVGAFGLLGQRLSDVVEQTRTLGGGYVHADLGGDHTGKQGNLNGVTKHVLAVAGTLFQSA